ncbi:MAG: hypothetical protein IJT36_07730 [Alphaproteobacteria bacterium]|nr:hypothetical protein [Alphaproteobacteria bacterium]
MRGLPPPVGAGAVTATVREWFVLCVVVHRNAPYCYLIAINKIIHTFYRKLVKKVIKKFFS